MSIYELHFAQIADLIALERRLIRAWGRDPTMLPRVYRYLYRYAINLAKIGWIRTPDGRDLSLRHALHAFRHWLKLKLLPLVPQHFMPDASGLLSLAPLVAVRTEITRTAILQRYSQDFGPETLDAEIGQKKLALVLGGGGGSGLAHLGLFQLLHEMHLQPSYIIGTSMGALVGLTRAVRRRYDPIAGLMALPRPQDLRKIFRPFSKSTFGFPGALDIDILPFAQEMFASTLGTKIPRFDELPIHFEVMVTGIRADLEWTDGTLEQRFKKVQGISWLPLRIRSRLKLFFDLAKQLAAQPNRLAEIVFHDEPGTEHMNVMEAIGFSCSVPGLLHFDLFHKSPETEAILREIFKRKGIYRLTDGGVVNNVPSRVAWTSIQKGKLGHRNAFIYAVDPFAPVPNKNAAFYPMQQIARPTVLENRPYSDFTRTLHASPNPINLAPTYRQLKQMVKRNRQEFLQDVPLIRGMMTPIPPFERWFHSIQWPHTLVSLKRKKQ